MFWLERKEPYAMPNILGNCRMSVSTYRWVQIKMCEKREPLEAELETKKDRSLYRITSNEN